MTNDKQQQGISLLELLLVLSIVAILVVLSLQMYENYTRARNMATLEKSVGQLMQSLNVYYNENCNNANVTNVDIQTLIDQNLIPQNISNPWGTLSVAIINTTNSSALPFYKLQVIAVITARHMKYNINLASIIRGALNGDPGVTNIVTWSRLPMHNTDDIASKMWLMMEEPGMTYMLPGRVISATGTGMSSSLWVLKNNLQAFSTAQQVRDPTQINNGVPLSVCPD